MSVLTYYMTLQSQSNPLKHMKYFNKLFTLLYLIVLSTEANQWEIMCKIISSAVFSLKKREVPDGPGDMLKILLGLLRDCSA